jgi:hypothetical protein
VTTNNPKNIDISTQAGLDLLKIKADYYGHYADFLKVKELIAEIENLRASTPEEVERALLEASKKQGW